MADLQNKCFALGDKIDKYTFRQRTSRKVSELVLKVCNEAKLNHDVALVCYCASMVYDAGFLSVPKSILTASELTMTERQKIREHVHSAAEYFDFVPEQIRPVFLQAAEFHHENMDGKGYLAGLTGANIPLIARVLQASAPTARLWTATPPLRNLNPRAEFTILKSSTCWKKSSKLWTTQATRPKSRLRRLPLRWRRPLSASSASRAKTPFNFCQKFFLAPRP